MHVCCCDRAGSGEPEFLFGPETERAEGGCSRHGEKTLGKLTGLRAWNFYLMPEPSSRRLHAFISRHQNTYKEVHGNVYGDVAAMLSTIPLSFGVLWSILSEAGRGSFPEEVRCARRNNCALVLRAAARLELPSVEACRVELVKAMACTPA